LAPTLDRGDIIIMDNLPTHKVGGVMKAIRAADAIVIFLPAYSPDLNPAKNPLNLACRQREGVPEFLPPCRL